MNHRKVLFQIIRNGVPVGTVTGIVNDVFPDLIVFEKSAPIASGDQFRPIRDLGPVVLDLEKD